MARVVCVHGIGKAQSGEDPLLAEWRPALISGLRRAAAARAAGAGAGCSGVGRSGTGGAETAAPGAAGAGTLGAGTYDAGTRGAGGTDAAGAVATIAESDVWMAFYGDLFRPPGRRLAVGDPRLTAADVEPGLEQNLLMAWWRHAAEVDPAVVPPDARTLARTPGSVQSALRALSRSAFFAEVALGSMVFDLKQVARYLTDPQLRGDAVERVWRAIGPDTEVVVAHSLGTVVAYEALCAMPTRNLRAFVTLGSPLGIRNLIYDRLRPEPGAWPGHDGLEWTNVVDGGDVVALEKDLRGLFGERVRSVRVHNGAKAHDASAYLTDALTGEAIARGLGAG